MKAKGLTPILNVSDFKQSMEWFQRLGWDKAWDWGDPPTFGGVSSGEAQIFLCLDGQGGRGRGSGATGNGDAGDKGVWMSVWVDDVDAIHAHCRANGIEVTFPPTDEPWHVREMHVRHPDGHIFRMSQSLDEEEDEE